MTDRTAAVKLRTTADLSGAQQLQQAYTALSAGDQKLIRDNLALAQSYARLKAAQGDAAGGAKFLQETLGSLSAAPARNVLAVQTQIEKLGSSTTLASQVGDALKSSMLSIVGPAALVATGMQAAQAAVQSFADAYNFKARIDQTNASIAIQLRGIRDSSATFAEAARFGQQYAFTQQQTSEAIQAALPIIRQSKASTEDVLGVFARLQVLKPEKSFGDAARALGELNAGQIVSIVDQFNISRAAANRMKDEIAGGADAVQVLSKYLDNAGIGMDTLAVRTQGAMGKVNELAQAEERRKLAQGGAAGGLGGFLTSAAIAAQDALTDAFSSNERALAASQARNEAYNRVIREGGTAAEAAKAAHDAWALAISQGNSVTELAASAVQGHSDRLKDDNAQLTASAALLSDDAKKRVDSAIATAQLADAQRRLDADSKLAAQGLLGSGNQALILANKYGIAADAAAFLIQQQQGLLNAQALADQRAGERSGGAVRTEAEQRGLTAARKLNADFERDRAEKAKQEAQKVADSRARLEESTAQTTAQKIALYQRRLNAATNEIDRNDAQAKLNDLRAQQARAAGRGASTIGTDLSLAQAGLEGADRLQARLDAVNQKLATAKLTENERNKLTAEKLDLEQKIGEELDKQRRGAVDARLAQIDNERKKLDEAIRTRIAQNVVNSASASEDQKARARLALEEVPLEQQKRALDIARLQRESGGVAPALGTTPGGTLPTGPAPAGAATAAAPQGGGASGQAVIMMDGKQVGVVLMPYLIQALSSGRAQVAASGG